MPTPAPLPLSSLRPHRNQFMNPTSLIVLAMLALLWGYMYIVRTTPVVLGGRELRWVSRGRQGQAGAAVDCRGSAVAAAG